MKSDFADFSVDYDLGEKIYKKDGMFDMRKNVITEKQRHYADNPKKYPKNAAQQIFYKLEIDLINNCEYVVAMLRVLYRYRQMVELMLTKTPNFMYDERIKLRKLFDSLMTEERVTGLVLITDDKLLHEIAEGDRPVYSDKVQIPNYLMSKMKGKHVDYTLKHLCCNNTFQRRFSFDEDFISKNIVNEFNNMVANSPKVADPTNGTPK